MSEKTIDALKVAVERDRIAAYRYLAFLDAEQRALVRELQPDRQPGDMVLFPVDELVSRLVSTTPLRRAVKVLEAVGLPPHAYDVWVDHLDVDIGGLPIIGQVK